RNSEVRIAIIGAGKVSAYHHVPGIALDPRAKLVAVCDADRDLAQMRSTEWNVPRFSAQPEEILSDPGIDAVIIATPNFTHHPFAIAAAPSGNHLMCENPLGL